MSNLFDDFRLINHIYKVCIPSNKKVDVCNTFKILLILSNLEKKGNPWPPLVNIGHGIKFPILACEVCSVFIYFEIWLTESKVKMTKHVRNKFKQNVKLRLTVLRIVLLISSINSSCFRIRRKQTTLNWILNAASILAKFFLRITITKQTVDFKLW